MATITDINTTTNVETWETTTESQVSVNRYDRRGHEKATVVGGRVGQRVQVTTAEREELNEERCANPAQDIFKNGFLRPIRNVPDEVMERFENETKPHGGLTVEEIVDSLENKKGNAFKAWVNGLNEATLRQVAKLAPEADATASQLAAIEDALENFRVRLRETQADRELRSAPKGVAAD